MNYYIATISGSPAVWRDADKNNPLDWGQICYADVMHPPVAVRDRSIIRRQIAASNRNRRAARCEIRLDYGIQRIVVMLPKEK